MGADFETVGGLSAGNANEYSCGSNLIIGPISVV